MKTLEALNQDTLFDLRDRTIIITGGLGQLGRRFSGSLLERGARIAVFDQKNKDTLIQHKNYLYEKADVTHPASLREALGKVMDKWGTPHGLVNAAALDSPPRTKGETCVPFEEFPASLWAQVLQTNVEGLFLACQIVGKEMAKTKRGSIVNIGSIYGMVSPDQRIYKEPGEQDQKFFKPAAYTASKAAIENLSRYLSTYWAEDSVRVNTLTLGGVFNDQDENFIKEYTRRVPLGRMAKPDDYNGALVFLLSDASAYMTGSNMVIDGGWTAW